MRFLKVLVIVMGVLIVVATTTLVVTDWPADQRVGHDGAGIGCGTAGRAGRDADRADRPGG